MNHKKDKDGNLLPRDKRISKFGQYDDVLKQYMISSPLIAQLGKNDEYKGLISGDVLLSYACDTVKQAQALLGGKIVYLECEDKVGLLEFYRSNGFVDFGKRLKWCFFQFTILLMVFLLNFLN